MPQVQPELPQEQLLPQVQLLEAEVAEAVVLVVPEPVEQQAQVWLLLPQVQEVPPEQLEQEQHMGSSSLSQSYRDVAVRSILCPERGGGTAFPKLFLYNHAGACYNTSRKNHRSAFRWQIWL